MVAPSEPVLDRSRFVVDFEDTFDAPDLDTTRWLPGYLPQWSTPDRSAARYAIGDGSLRLRIDADQPPWCPDLDGDLRVSSVQTGVRSGPAGSSVGQHRFHPAATVRTPQAERILHAPLHGLVEMRARALVDPRAMVALWMIGTEDVPEHSGEICIAEIFGRDATVDRARVGMGIHPFDDPRLVDDFDAPEQAVDVRMFHVYSADWTTDSVAWYVDDRLVRVVHQSPSYPMQLMLGIYEFPAEGPDPRDAGVYPKTFEVDWVRSGRRRA